MVGIRIGAAPSALRRSANSDAWCGARVIRTRRPASGRELEGLMLVLFAFVKQHLFIQEHSEPFA